MNRLLVFALVASIGNASMAFAGETILASGTRHVQELSVGDTGASATAAAAVPSTTAVKIGAKAPAPVAYQAQGGNLSNSGMSGTKKAMIYIGLAVGFVASAWAIDHGVKDITPSSLGTRQD